MSRAIDLWLPWFGDLLALGGPVLGLILFIAFFIWLLLCERIFYLLFDFPRELERARSYWLERREWTSWYAKQHRIALREQLSTHLTRNYSLIGTLIKICPLLGLLGTVIGMLEVFDALAATGSNNPRSMASGVSKATVSTLAGMVVAIVGLLATNIAERRAFAARDVLDAHFPQGQENSHA